MEVVGNNFLPGDPRLVDHIVYELKSQGIFDHFRKECISDVDTKPAYQNLRQRVEGSVSGFLRAQRWSPNMNKNHVREMLRKNIYESGFLETGVERIVDQVVNPKINTIFLPQVEDVVYRFLGIQKPSRLEPTFSVGSVTQNIPNNLLPTDLEAVSPESETFERKLNQSDDYQKLDDSKMEDDESPPFEPIEKEGFIPPLEENSIDSHLSGFSGLISHDSNHSIDNSAKFSAQMEISNQDSQISKQSSDERFSVEMSDDSSKMEVNEDVTPKSSKNAESNSKSFEFANDSQTSSNSSTKQDRSESNKRLDLSKLETEGNTRKDDKKSVDRSSGSSEKHRPRHENKSNSRDRKDKDRKDSKHRQSSKESGDRDKSKDKDRRDSKSSTRSEKDKKSVKEKDKEKSTKERSEKDKEKSDKDKEKSQKDKEKDKKSTSRHSSSSRDKSSSKKDRSENKSKVSSSKENKESKNSHGDSKSRSKHASKSSSLENRRKEDKRSNNHSSSSKKEKDKKDKKDPKKESKDDHFSSKGKRTDRRSTDRDSNDGNSTSRKSSQSFTELSSSSHPQNNTEDSSVLNSGSGDSGNSECHENEMALLKMPTILTEAIVDSNEIILAHAKVHQNLQLAEIPKLKLIKPKFASNIFEARRLMKIRKQLDRLERQNQRTIDMTYQIATVPVVVENSVTVEPQKAPIFLNDEQENEELHPMLKKRPNILKKYSRANHLKLNSPISKLNHCASKPKISLEAEGPNTQLQEDHAESPVKELTPPLSSSVISKASWDAIEAKLNQQNLLNVDYDSYLDTSETPNDAIAPTESEEHCYFFSQSSCLRSQKTLKILSREISKLESEISALSSKLRSNIEERRRFAILKRYNSCHDENDRDNLETSPKNKGTKRKSTLKDLPDIDNNNKKFTNNCVAEDIRKLDRTTLKISDAQKIKVKAKKQKQNTDNADIADEGFPLPLSPAESDKSNEKKSEITEVPHKHKRNSNIKGANNTRGQRYTSDDLYKPRLSFTGSRRRAAKNLKAD